MNVDDGSVEYLGNNSYYYSYQGTPKKVVLKRGIYCVELWGASGGGPFGGKGGYSSGILTLHNQKSLFFYIGGQGKSYPGNPYDGCIEGGWNGGGDACAIMYQNSGGGGTDIRLSQNENYEDRIIVAGGGGGRSEKYGFGGGLTGYHGIIAQSTSGSQTSGGKTEIGIDGDLGYGGYTQKDYAGISGGGGGYYGGGATSNALGGSGFIDTTFFYRYETIPGNETVPTPFGGFDQGHSGDGVAKITYVNAFYGCTKEMRIQIRLFLTLYISLYVKF